MCYYVELLEAAVMFGQLRGVAKAGCCSRWGTSARSFEAVHVDVPLGGGANILHVAAGMRLRQVHNTYGSTTQTISLPLPGLSQAISKCFRYLCEIPFLSSTRKRVNHSL